MQTDTFGGARHIAARLIQNPLDVCALEFALRFGLPTALERFAAFLEQAERSPLTIKNYLSDMRAFAAWFEEANGDPFEPAKITPTDLREYKPWMVSHCGFKPNSVKIGAGREWAAEIDANLNDARIILRLISADFLASDYCYDKEMLRAMERHEAGEAVVIPVILRQCVWQGAPFGKLQGLPKDFRPVKEWPDLDQAFTDIARSIRKAVAEPQASQPVAVAAKTPRVWNVAHRRNPNFTGREELLAEIGKALTSGHAAALTQAITGLGGVGKTQTAVEYAYRHESDYRVVWWIKSEEPTNRNGHAIVTSRDPNWRGVAETIQVKPLPRDESIEFLINRTGQNDRQVAGKLAEALGDLRLAMEQAGAYIAPDDIPRRSLFRPTNPRFVIRCWIL